MPIAVLKWKLPQEQQEFHDALNGTNYSIILSELDNWLRNKDKYEDQPKISVASVRAELLRLQREYLSNE